MRMPTVGMAVTGVSVAVARHPPMKAQLRAIAKLTPARSAEEGPFRREQVTPDQRAARPRRFLPGADQRHHAGVHLHLGGELEQLRLHVQSLALVELGAGKLERHPFVAV